MFAAPSEIAAMQRHVERRPLIKRGALTMTLSPVEFHWNAARVALSPIETALFAALVRRSRLSWDDANRLLALHGCCIDSRDVLIHRIRRKFADVGACDPIETLRGWGIRFRTEPDREGSSAFWIGASAGEAVLDS